MRSRAEGGLRVRSLNATTTRTHSEPNEALPLVLCALTAINNVALARRPARGDLPRKRPDGSKIVLTNGRIVLTLCTWYALGFA